MNDADRARTALDNLIAKAEAKAATAKEVTKTSELSQLKTSLMKRFLNPYKKYGL